MAITGNVFWVVGIRFTNGLLKARINEICWIDRVAMRTEIHNNMSSVLEVELLDLLHKSVFTPQSAVRPAK